MLGELATQTHATMTEVLDAALDHYRRHRFLQQANDAYAQLATDATAYTDYQADLGTFDATLGDGLTESSP